MANTARTPDPRYTDPANPVPPTGIDPALDPYDARVSAANTDDPRIINRVESRSSGSGMLIVAAVLVLAVVAYFVFAPGGNEMPAPADPAVTTEPATPPMAPAAPDAMAPAAPATPDTMAPAATTPAPVEPAPAPANPAPAAPAPAQ